MDDKQFARGLGQLLAGLHPGGRHCYFRHTDDLDETLAYVHYSDSKFRGSGAVIFGQDTHDLRWIYGKELADQSFRRATNAWILAGAETGERDTARRRQTYYSVKPSP